MSPSYFKRGRAVSYLDKRDRPYWAVPLLRTARSLCLISCFTPRVSNPRWPHRGSLRR
jgi:hypothetical protein